MKLFSVYDSKAEAYLPIFQSATIGTAIRTFEQAVNEESSPFHKHAADYTLFMIGEYDEQTGIVSPIQAGHTNLGTALSFLAAAQNIHEVAV